MRIALVFSKAAVATAFVLTAFAVPSLAQSAASDKTAQSGKTSPAPLSVNLNTATVTELEALPGVGLATATRIIEYRQKNGAFKKIEDLMNVRGIGEKTFLNLKSMIVVTPAKGTW